MNTVQVNTSELTGLTLDYMVAVCEGYPIKLDYQYTEETHFPGWWQCGPGCWQPLRKYSTDWAQGGPIIEREGISLMPPAVYHIGKERHALETNYWRAYSQEDAEAMRQQGRGDTPLIAAMRCYVQSKMGAVVSVPREILDK